MASELPRSLDYFKHIMPYIYKQIALYQYKHVMTYQIKHLLRIALEGRFSRRNDLT